MLSLFWGQEPAWPGLASLALLPKRETKAAESFPPASAGDPHGLILCVKTQRTAGIARTPCGHTYTSAHAGARLTLACRCTRPSAHTRRSLQILASTQALRVNQVFIKKEGQAPAWPACSPTAQGRRLQLPPQGLGDPGPPLVVDRGMAPEPRGQGQRP